MFSGLKKKKKKVSHSLSLGKDRGQFPNLYCVLDGEKKVMCSWEVSRELDHIITYQLACQHNHTTPWVKCVRVRVGVGVHKRVRVEREHGGNCPPYVDALPFLRFPLVGLRSAACTRPWPSTTVGRWCDTAACCLSQSPHICFWNFDQLAVQRRSGPMSTVSGWHARPKGKKKQMLRPVVKWFSFSP